MPLDPSPTLPPVGGDTRTGPHHERYGVLGAAGWQVAAKGITAVTDVATLTHHAFHRLSHYQQVEWRVIPPDGVGDYTVVWGRWISAPASKFTKGVALEMFSADGTEQAIAGDVDFSTYQRTERDPVGLFITAITGSAAARPREGGDHEPDQLNGTLPDGFIILVRGANRE